MAERASLPAAINRAAARLAADPAGAGREAEAILKMAPNDPRALLILASFYTGWNLPSVVIEIFWAAISLYGLARSLLRRR